MVRGLNENKHAVSGIMQAFYCTCQRRADYLSLGRASVFNPREELTTTTSRILIIRTAPLQAWPETRMITLSHL